LVSAWLLRAAVTWDGKFIRPEFDDSGVEKVWEFGH
jgi:hypothetical protein